MEYKLIALKEIPPRGPFIRKPKGPFIRKGWSRIIQQFVESDYKIAYIQLETKRQMQLAAAAFCTASHSWAKGVKVSSYGHLLRVYLEKL